MRLHQSVGKDGQLYFALNTDDTGMRHWTSFLAQIAEDDPLERRAWNRWAATLQLVEVVA